MKHLFHVQQPLALLLGELHHGNARPVGHDPRDGLGVYLSAAVAAALLPLLFRFIQPRLHRLLLVAQLCRALKVLLVDGARLFAFELFDLLLQLLDVVGRGHGGKPHLGRALVDEVDRLVGQVAVGDVARGQLDRR